MFTADQLIDGYLSEVVSATGISEHLAKALSIGLIPIVLFGAGLLFSISRGRRDAGEALFTVLLVGYYVTLWVATKDQLVTKTGDPRKCYVITEQEVLYRQIRDKGFDPTTGRPCEPVTTEIIPRLEKLDGKLRSDEPIQPVGTPESFFSVATGEPIIWYWQSTEGDYVFFDTPGFYPATGERLEPATQEVVAGWQQLLARREGEARQKAHQEEFERQQEAKRLEAARQAEEAEEERQQVLAKQAEEAAAKAEAERLERERLREMQKLVAAGGETASGPSVGLAITPAQPDDALDQVATATLTGLLVTAAPAQVRVVGSMFADRFYTDGHFARAYEGDVTPLHESQSLRLLSHLALGKVSVACLPNPTIQQMVACDVSFAYRVFSNSGSVVASTRLTERGPGFSEANAVERGAELLIERNKDELFRIFGR